MKRRDTIIIAVLLNAGLLIMLFATSLKSDKTEEVTSQVSVLATHQPEPMQVMPAPVVAAAPVTGDEVDQVLKQYITPQVTNTEPQQNFLADLQAIGTGAPAAPVEPTAPAPIETSFKEVKVKKGDVLERIARQNHVSVQDIMKANNLSTTRLKIGQSLKIPTKSGVQTVASHFTDSAQYYTVKNGDNPWTIAVRHHMKVEELLQLNGMDESKARRLKPGDRIRIK